MGVITKQEAADILKVLPALNKIGIVCKEKAAIEWQETFVSDVVLEFLKILPDILDKLTEENVE